MNKATKPAKAKPANLAAGPSPREARKAKVIEVLNRARAMELNAITQYMNQHYGLDNMDYGALAADIDRKSTRLNSSH